MNKLNLILENIRNKYTLELLTEGEGTATEKEILTGKVMINEATANIAKICTKTNLFENTKMLVETGYEEALANFGAITGGSEEFNSTSKLIDNVQTADDRKHNERLTKWLGDNKNSVEGGKFTDTTTNLPTYSDKIATKGRELINTVGEKGSEAYDALQAKYDEMSKQMGQLTAKGSDTIDNALNTAQSKYDGLDAETKDRVKYGLAATAGLGVAAAAPKVVNGARNQFNKFKNNRLLSK